MTYAPIPTGDEFVVNTVTAQWQTGSAIAGLSNGNYVIVWETAVNQPIAGTYKTNLYDVKAQLYTADGTPIGAEVTVNTDPTYGSLRAKVAPFGVGGFVVVYESNSDAMGTANGIEIGMQLFDASGTKLGGETRVNSVTDNGQEAPSVAQLDDGGFIVVWTSRSGAYGPDDVKAQRYNATGAKTGPEFMVNTTTAEDQFDAKVSALASGGFVVTWTSELQDGDQDGVFAQVYDAAGAAVGGEIQVNSHTDDDQGHSDVVATADGGFVVVWQSWFQAPDGSYEGVFGQKFDAAGTKVGAEFMVNTYTTWNQASPAITATPDGGFVVAWTSFDEYGGGQDNGSPGIYMQRYDAAAMAVGPESRAHPETTSGELRPDIEVLEDGTYVTSWNSYDGSDYDIVARRFAAQQFGTDADETLQGGAADDWIEGGAGADDLSGGAGLDTLSYAISAAGVNVSLATGYAGGGDAAGDTISGFEALMGSEHDDILSGDNGDNTLNGQAGDDLLRGRGGADWLEGGSGTDTADYSESAGWVNVSLLTGFTGGGAGSHAVGDGFSSIENLTGSAFGDRLNGDNGDNVLEGGAGADTLDGNGGTDTASYAGSAGWVNVSLLTGFTGGGAGSHAVGDSFAQIENLRGSAFDDRLTGDDDKNVLEGGAGADTLIGADGVDFASYANSPSRVEVSLLTGETGGGAGNHATGDTLSMIEGLIGSRYDDILTANFHDNTLDGGDGDDLLRSSSGADRLVGGNGIDTASYELMGGWAWVEASLLSGAAWGYAFGDSFDSIENLTGSNDSDKMSGDHGVNVLKGLRGNDALQGYGGADVLEGGDGVDVASYSGSGDWVEVSLLTGFTGGGTGSHALGDTFDSIENLKGSGFDDRLSGDNGDNVLEGTGGADMLDGNGGSDTASYGGSTAVNVSLLTGYAAGGHAVGDTFDSIENLIGSRYDDRLNGDNGDNVLEGNQGADTLVGNGGSDTASYTLAYGVNVSLLTGSTDGGHAVGDVFLSIENLIGSPGDDRLNGDHGVNVLTGGEGNDLLRGRGGADDLLGGAGQDSADYADSAGFVNVSLLTGFAGGGSGSHALGDTFDSIENLTGSAYDDRLNGDHGVNVLTGGGGNDLLRGRGGADDLRGGAGQDSADYADSAGFVNVSLLTGFAGGGSGSHALGDSFDSIENLRGSAHDDLLNGDNGDNVLEGGAGDDILRGNGGIDTFVFAAGFGTDTVQDFEDGSDLLDFTGHSGVSGIGDLTVSASGADALVSDGAGGTITLTGAAGLIDADDFLF